MGTWCLYAWAQCAIDVGLIGAMYEALRISSKGGSVTNVGAFALPTAGMRQLHGRGTMRVWGLESCQIFLRLDNRLVD